MRNMYKNKRLISLTLVFMLLLQVVVPFTVAFASDDWKVLLIDNKNGEVKSYTNYTYGKHVYDFDYDGDSIIDTGYGISSYINDELKVRFNMQFTQNYRIEVYLTEPDNFANENIIAEWQDELENNIVNWEYLYTTDSLGNTVPLTNSAGEHVREITNEDEIDNFKEEELGQFLGYIIEADTGDVIDSKEFEGYTGDVPPEMRNAPAFDTLNDIRWDGEIKNDNFTGYLHDMPNSEDYLVYDERSGIWYFPIMIVVQPLGNDDIINGDWTEQYITVTGAKLSPYDSDDIAFSYGDANDIYYLIDDPVNLINGNFIYSNQDLLVSGKNPIYFSRYYNSLDFRNLEFGNKFRHTFMYDIVDRGYFVDVILPDNTMQNFALRENGTYYNTKGDDFILNKTNGKYTLYDNLGNVYYFNSDDNISLIKNSGETLYDFEYQGQNLIKVSTDSVYINLEYNNNKISKITASDGQEVSYSYDNDNLVKFTNSDDFSKEYEYDSNNNITSIDDLADHVYLKNTYDERNRIIKQEMTGRGTSTFTYNSETKINTHTDVNGNITKVHYNDNRIEKVIDDNGEIINTFDDHGSVISTKDKLGNETTYEYSEGELLTKITYPNGTSKKMEYNNNYQLIKEIMPNGGEYEYEYTSSGKISKVINPLDNETVYTYDSNDNLISVKDYMNFVTRYEYDSNNNVVKIIDPEGYETNFVYDNKNRIIKEIYFNGGYTKYEYSEGGRLLKTIDSDGNVQEFDTDGNGNHLVDKDEFGNEFKSEYNVFNQLISLTDPLGNVIKYEYDEYGNQSKVIYSEGNTKEYVYDNYGNKVKEIDGLGNETTYTYDELNRIVSVTNPIGEETRSEYDDMGNLIKNISPSGSTTSYRYDNYGRKTKEVDALGNITSYEYDILNRLVKVTDPMGNESRTIYDANGNVSSQIDALGNATNMEHDSKGNVTKVTDPLGNEHKYEYNGNSKKIKYIDPYNEDERFIYNSNGDIIEYIDKKGVSSYYYYNEDRSLSSVKFANGSTISYEYDMLGRNVKTIDELGFTIETTFDGNGNVLSKTNKDGGVTKYEYDANDTKIKEIDPEGNTVQFFYDAAGRNYKTINPNGDTIVNSYNTGLQIDKTIFPNGGELKYEYDVLGRNTSLTTPEGRTAYLKYDKNGRVIKEYDQLGNGKKYTYDANGNIIVVTDALGNTVNTDYDANGRVIKVTDEMSNVYTYTYDAFGNVLSSTDPMGYTEYKEYDVMGYLSSTKDKNGNVTNYAVDNMGRLTKVTDPLGNQSTFEYNLRGNLVKQISPEQVEVNYEYDEVGRILKVIDPHTHLTNQSYDLNGNVVSITDELGNTRYIEYDNNQNVVKKSDNLDNNILFTYDSMNNLTSITSRSSVGNNITTYEYDLDDKLIKETDVLGNSNLTTYDSVGRVETFIDKDGIKTTFTYDKLNRPTKVEYGDGTEVNYTFNADGTINNFVDWNGTTSFEYDANGRTIKVIDHNNQILKYEYDKNNNETKIIYPNLEEVTKLYDANNKLLSVTDSELGTYTYQRDNLGRELKLTYPNGEITEKAYNKLSQVVQVKEIEPDGSTRRTTKYNYNDAGHIINKYSIGVGANSSHQVDEYYEYDKNGRMVKLRDSEGNSTTYTYDSAGNMLKENKLESETVYNYNLMNQLISKSEKNQRTDYTYDKRGNLTEEKSNDSTKKYEYNSNGKLVTGTNSGGENTNYKYNALGYRVAQTTKMINYNKSHQNNNNSPGSEFIGNVEDITDRNKPTTNDHTWQNSVHLIRQQNTNDDFITISKTYVSDYVQTSNSDYKSDLVVTTEGDSSQRLSYGNTLLGYSNKKVNTSGYSLSEDIANTQSESGYIHTNISDGVTFITNSDADMLVYTETDPWGNLKTKVNLDENFSGINLNALYTIHEYDSVIDKYFAKNRFFSSTDKTFIQVDSKLDGYNWYELLASSPMNFVDYDGNTTTDVTFQLYDHHNNVLNQTIAESVLVNGRNHLKLRDMVDILPGGSTVTSHGTNGYDNEDRTYKFIFEKNGETVEAIFDFQNQEIRLSNGETIDNAGQYIHFENGTNYIEFRWFLTEVAGIDNDTIKDFGFGDTHGTNVVLASTSSEDILGQTERINVKMVGSVIYIHARIFFKQINNDINDFDSYAEKTDDGKRRYIKNWDETSKKLALDGIKMWSGTYTSDRNTTYDNLHNYQPYNKDYSSVNSNVNDRIFKPSKGFNNYISENSFIVIVTTKDSSGMSKGNNYITYNLMVNPDIVYDEIIKPKEGKDIPDYHYRPWAYWSNNAPNSTYQIFLVYQDINDEELFKRGSAHEFGHVLGLGDAYDVGRYIEGDNRFIDSQEVPLNDIMNLHYLDDAHVTLNDIEMLIHAWFIKNTRQNFGSSEAIEVRE